MKNKGDMQENSRIQTDKEKQKLRKMLSQIRIKSESEMELNATTNVESNEEKVKKINFLFQFFAIYS